MKQLYVKQYKNKYEILDNKDSIVYNCIIKKSIKTKIDIFHLDKLLYEVKYKQRFLIIPGFESQHPTKLKLRGLGTSLVD